MLMGFAFPLSRRAGAVHRLTAIRRVRLVVGVSGFVAGFLMRVAVLVVIVLTFVRVVGAFAVVPFTGLAMLLMVGQFADFMTFAGPEEHDGRGRRDGDRLAEN